MFILTVCVGMFMSMCGALHEFKFETMEQCQEAKKEFSKETIGKGYAICLHKDSKIKSSSF